VTEHLSGLARVDWTSWLSREPWSTLFTGAGGAVVAALFSFLAAIWVLRRTRRRDRADAMRLHEVALLAVEQQARALAESQRRERTISAVAQLTSGWVTPGWEWVALGPNLIHGLPHKRRWELVRRWLADGSRLYMNLVDDELVIYQAITRTTAVLHGLLASDAGGPETYIATARTFSVAVNDWIRGDRSIEETAVAINLEVDRLELSPP
jgi:hypothetical protein